MATPTADAIAAPAGTNPVKWGNTPGARALTLVGPGTGITGQASTFTVTPDKPLNADVTITLSAPGATVTPATVTLAKGSSASASFSVTRSTDGTSSVSITNNGGLTNAGSPISFTTAASGVPAWLAGAPLMQWVPILGTSGAGGSIIDAFSGFTVVGTKLYVLAAAGHTDGPDNRVVSIDLGADAPAWSTRIAASVSSQTDVRHYTDNKPSARHTYDNGFYVPALDRVFLVGCTYAYGAGNNYAAVDAYQVTGNAWDYPGTTYADVPEGDGSGKRGAAFDGTAIWSNTLRKFVPSTNTWTNPITTRVTGTDAPLPLSYDSTRGQLFGITSRSGSLVASRTPVAGTQEFTVSFNASAALTQFTADQGWYAGMDYDPVNDFFWWYAGQTFDTSGNVLSNVPGRIYQIKPANSGNWDISLPTIAGTTPGSSPAGGQGTNGRIKYIPALKGFALLTKKADNIYFCRTA